MYQLFGLQNVYLDPNSAYAINELVEEEYLAGIVREVARNLPSFSSFQFYVYAPGPRLPESRSIPSARKILFHLTDEHYTVPVDLCKEYFAVFKCNLPTDQHGVPNLFSIPLGYAKGLPKLEAARIEARTTSVFFSGNLNANRIRLFKALSGLSWLADRVVSLLIRFGAVRQRRFDSVFADSYIGFTDGFMSGLRKEAYAKFLNSSKIVLCPAGFCTNETLRAFEGMRQGAVVFSEKLPDVHFYRNSPIVQVENWRVAFRQIRELLKNEDQMIELQKRTLEWWDNVCSETAVAKFVASKVSSLDNGA